MTELRRYSSYRGRRLGYREAFLERLAMRGVFDLFLIHVAARADKVLVPRTRGRVSVTGLNRVGFLTTTGAKTGGRRSHSVVLMVDGDDFIVSGAHYGRPTHPAWSHNLVAHPDCEVVFRGSKGRYRAELLQGAARDAAWATALDFYPGFALYAQRAAPREIRMFRLRRQ